jgi:hypothetical protein
MIIRRLAGEFVAARNLRWPEDETGRCVIPSRVILALEDMSRGFTLKDGTRMGCLDFQTALAVSVLIHSGFRLTRRRPGRRD